MTAIDLLTYAAADNTPECFLHADAKDIEPFVERVVDKTLKETLLQGVGYMHEGLCAEDKSIVESLFDSGAIQVRLIFFNRLIFDIGNFNDQYLIYFYYCPYFSVKLFCL